MLISKNFLTREASYKPSYFTSWSQSGPSGTPRHRRSPPPTTGRCANIALRMKYHVFKRLVVLSAMVAMTTISNAAGLCNIQKIEPAHEEQSAATPHPDADRSMRTGAAVTPVSRVSDLHDHALSAFIIDYAPGGRRCFIAHPLRAMYLCTCCRVPSRLTLGRRVSEFITRPRPGLSPPLPTA